MNQNLATRIKLILDQNSAKVLLEDDVIQLTGQDIKLLIQKLQPLILKSSIPGSRIGICFPNWAIQGLSFLAVLLSERVPVILSSSDVTLNPSKWLTNSELALILCEEDASALIEQPVPLIRLSRDGLVLDTPVGILSEVAAAPVGTGLILYTSGSTGKPKEIFVPEAGILATADHLIQYFGLDSSTVAPLVLPVCHSMALNTQFLPTLLVGGRSSFINSRFILNKLYREISASQGNFVAMIGEVLRSCVDEKRKRNLPPNLNVKHVQLAGGMILLQHLEMAHELFPNAIIHKGYGLTEAIRVTMINHLDPLFTTNTVGKPLPFLNVEIRTADGSIAAPDEEGEVFVQGPSVMLAGPETKVGTVDEKGFLATGDLGSLNEDGFLKINGRSDSVFKINGNRISGFEVENTSRGISSAVRDVKCIAVPTDKRVGLKLVLFVEVSHDKQQAFFETEFEAFKLELWERSKSLSLFPRDIIVMKRFPKTSNGKIQTPGFHAAWNELTETSLKLEAFYNFQFYQITETARTEP